MLRKVSLALMLAAFAAMQSGCGLLCCGSCGLFGPSCGNEWCGYDCGDAYYGDWWGCCDPCDDCGDWNGASCCHGGHSYHGHHHAGAIDGEEFVTEEVEEVIEQREEVVMPKQKRPAPALKGPKKEPLHAESDAAKTPASSEKAHAETGEHEADE